jgi:hypothetical protein
MLHIYVNHNTVKILCMLRNRVVNVASALGTAYIGWSSEERRKQFLACTTVEDVHNQMKEFLE